MRLKSLNLALGVLVAVSAVLVSPGSVRASCVPGRSNDSHYYWDGRTQTPGGITRGVSSSIYAYDAYVPSGGISYAWVMLAKNGYNYTWAQIGNYEVVNHVRHTTIQYAWSIDNIYQIDLPARALGSSTWEAVTWNAQTLRYSFQIGGVEQRSVLMGWVANNDQISGEINTASVQMMGAVNVHQTFVNNNILTASGWILFSGTVMNSNGNWFGQSGTAASFGVWDKACSS